MKRPRASIASMMAAVFFVALAVASLTRPSPLWGGLFHWLTLGLLCLAALGTAFRSGTGRQFWAGFALFGWANYLLVSLALPYHPVAMLVDYLLPAEHMASPGFDMGLTHEGAIAFRRIAYSLWVVATGFFGGTLSRFFFNGDNMDAVPFENERGPMPRREE